MSSQTLQTPTHNKCLELLCSPTPSFCWSGGVDAGVDILDEDDPAGSIIEVRSHDITVRARKTTSTIKSGSFRCASTYIDVTSRSVRMLANKYTAHAKTWWDVKGKLNPFTRFIDVFIKNLKIAPSVY
jgi:hypothetical protein